ncbi:MAG: hypothetical protein CSA31_01550 [Desulfobulbus propionicus]|nr:MAG: hypothetical protein CSA31_01550 [Desulfobulbus propionicus]
MQGMIKRSITHTLLQGIAQSPAVVLLGAHQVGKTTLAKTIATNIGSTYLDLVSCQRCSVVSCLSFSALMQPCPVSHSTTMQHRIRTGKIRRNILTFQH